MTSLSRCISMNGKEPAVQFYVDQPSTPSSVDMAATVVPDPGPSKVPAPLRFHLRFKDTVTSLSLSTYGMLALLTEVIALVTFTVSFAVPYWMQASDTMGDVYSGLWRLCAYSYCEYFTGHPMYKWFHTVQVCASLSLICQFVVTVILCTYACVEVWKNNRLTLVWTAATLLTIAEVLQLAGVLLYGVYQGEDQGTLAWAFYLAVVSCLLILAPLSCLLLEAYTLLRPKPRPVLHRSVSDTSMASTPARERSASLARMRVNSLSMLISPNDPNCYDNNAFDCIKE